jgi:hypothetical protein
MVIAWVQANFQGKNFITNDGKLLFDKYYRPIFYCDFSKTRLGNMLTCAILVLKVAPLSSCVFSP